MAHIPERICNIEARILRCPSPNRGSGDRCYFANIAVICSRGAMCVALVQVPVLGYGFVKDMFGSWPSAALQIEARQSRVCVK